ncbi:hypothetical protein ACFQRB_19585 [Halobaculum litoreum]|uniref:Uncharacterized protein n=1 Tax=Halobaculum litoreum TaxID=3031998 RepID=A0ABD5XX26_9EURY
MAFTRRPDEQECGDDGADEREAGPYHRRSREETDTVRDRQTDGERQTDPERERE